MSPTRRRGTPPSCSLRSQATSPRLRRGEELDGAASGTPPLRRAATKGRWLAREASETEGRSDRRSALLWRRPVPRRGFVLLAVLVVAGIGLAVAATVLMLARAETAGARRAAEATRAQVLAWSGLQVVAGELARERGRMLRGEAPRIERQMIVEEDGSRLGVVRLLPIGGRGELLVSEGGKIDLLRVSALELEAGGVDPAVAAAVVAAREAAGGRLDSVEALVGAPGLSMAALFGPPESLDLRGAIEGREEDRRERILDRLGSDAPLALVDLLGVFSIEPSIDSEGEPRVLASPWSPDVEEIVREKVGEIAATAIARRLGGERPEGAPAPTERDLAQALLDAGLPAGEWVAALDVLAVDPSPWRSGRLDLNLAPVEAIRMLPGITPEQAEEIVRVREDLSPEERRTVMWPALREILPLAAYPELVERISPRSLAWRVRLACGSVSTESPEGPIEDATVWEVVIDLSGDRPRFAAIREITQLDLVARLVLHLDEGSFEAVGESSLGDSAPAEPSPGDRVSIDEEPDDAFGGDLDSTESDLADRLEATNPLPEAPPGVNLRRSQGNPRLGGDRGEEAGQDGGPPPQAVRGRGGGGGRSPLGRWRRWSSSG